MDRSGVRPKTSRAKRTRGGTALALGIRGVRPVRFEGAHLTLKFLGEVGADRINDVLSAMRLAAANVAPFRQLRDGLENAFADAGFQRDRRAFSPHVTVAIVRDRLTAADSKRLMVSAAASIRPTAPIEFDVNRISLMRSDARPDWSVYTRLGEAVLGRDEER